MKQLLKTMIFGSIVISLAFSANKQILKSEMKMDRMNRVEPDYRNGPGASRQDCPHQYPNNPNAEFTVVDSSSNGYGMVATVTRPFDINSDGNMLVVYRQFAGPGNTHGQLGAAYSTISDGQNLWNVQYNINYNGNPPWGGGGVGGIGSGQARYPSAIASEEYPYAIWNEYTGGPPTDPPWPDFCSDYGGRPYFSYDQFGWGGGSWMYPADLDPLWDCNKDLWQSSVGYGYDANGEHHVSAVFDDWTRTGSYLFTSEVVADGYIVLGTETLAVNPQHLGTDNYSSSAILSMNDNGQGILGIDGIFAGNDMDAGTCTAPAINLTCNKTPMFKVTDDFGESWTGNHGAFDFYFVPNEVFDDIFSYWPDTDQDACTGDNYQILDFWSWYEFDMRVDNLGNPHIVISLIAESSDYFHFMDGYTGFYHITIDRNYLVSPGGINTPEGWNWSYIPLPANDSFVWNRPDGQSYLYGAMAQLSISRENPDIIYVTGNFANNGPMSEEMDQNGDGIQDDPCAILNSPWDLYPEWSEDIWVAKSIDNGSTWSALNNVTQTPRDPSYDGPNQCTPEEQYPHAAHWADDDRVYFAYNQPNWGWNEIGDLLGADHMNRVFVGYSYIEDGEVVEGCTDPSADNYNPEASFDDGSCEYGCTNALGDVNEDNAINVLDIVMLVNGILYGGLSDCALEAADQNGDGAINVLDIVELVNMILTPRDVDATSATIQINDGALLLQSDGYIGGVQMTLQHNKDFSIELTDNALVAEYRTVGNETEFVIVVPESEELFTFAGDFEIVDMIVANSEGEVNVDMLYEPTMVTEFSLSTAYPNPFNPTTNMTLAVPEAGYVSVQIYNLAGQVVATLVSGYMEANTSKTLTWDASNVASGTYFVKMQSGDFLKTQNLMLVK